VTTVAKRVYVSYSQVQAARELVKRSATNGRSISTSIKKIAEPKTKVTRGSARSAVTGRFMGPALTSEPPAKPAIESEASGIARARNEA